MERENKKEKKNVLVVVDEEEEEESRRAIERVLTQRDLSRLSLMSFCYHRRRQQQYGQEANGSSASGSINRFIVDRPPERPNKERDGLDKMDL